MPYIVQNQKVKLIDKLQNLINEIQNLEKEKPGSFAGILNYCVTTIAMEVMKNNGGLKYSNIALISGVLKNVSDEFYRRVASPYEDKKIKENGDISCYE